MILKIASLLISLLLLGCGSGGGDSSVDSPLSTIFDADPSIGFYRLDENGTILNSDSGALVYDVYYLALYSSNTCDFSYRHYEDTSSIYHSYYDCTYSVSGSYVQMTFYDSTFESFNMSLNFGSWYDEDIQSFYIENDNNETFIGFF